MVEKNKDGIPTVQVKVEDKNAPNLCDFSELLNYYYRN